MADFIALIDGEPGAFGVVFPDCPGCTAMGATMDEALGQASEALREWIGGRIAAGLDAPRPRTVAEIRADPDTADDFDAGARVAAIPLAPEQVRALRLS